MRALAALVVFAAVLPAAQGPTRDSPAAVETASTGTGTIAGVVLGTGTRPQPLRRVSVALSSEDATVDRVVINNDDGRFAFDGLSPGRYFLVAKKPGYLTMPYGARRFDRPGTPISMEAGQRVTDLTLLMPAGAVITGTIFGPDGEPAPNASVRLERKTPSGFELPMAARAADAVTITIADDRGVYRFYGLPADQYTVVATTRSPDYIAFYYPGTVRREDIQSVSVAAGEERSGVDVHQQRVALVRLGGKVAAPSSAANGVHLQLLPHGPTIEPGKDGTFVFTGLVPGTYQVRVWSLAAAEEPRSAAVPAEWGLVDVVLGGQDVTNVFVPLAPTLSVAGRVIFEDLPEPTPAALALARVTFSRVPPTAPGDVHEVSVHANGRFTVPGVSPGNYRLSASMSADAGPWTLKSAMASGRNALDFPIQIAPGDVVSDAVVTFTRKTQAISGSLQDASGRPTSDFTIVVFSSDRRYWTTASRWIRTAPVATNGTFTLVGLAAGEYRIAAVTDLEPEELRDSSFFDQIMSASLPITLAPGETKQQGLRVGNGR